MNIKLTGNVITELSHVLDASVELIVACHPTNPTELLWEQLARIIKPHGVIVTLSHKPFASGLAGLQRDMFRYSWTSSFYQPYTNVTVWCKTNPRYNQQDDDHQYPIDTPTFDSMERTLEYIVKTYTNEHDTMLTFDTSIVNTQQLCEVLKRNFIGIEEV